MGMPGLPEILVILFLALIGGIIYFAIKLFKK
jgi:hypothetical protein